MLTESIARQFAEDWVRAWNSHDLEGILSHYGSAVTLVSPVAARLMNDPSGAVRGKDALRAYFERGLAANPNLNFKLLDVMWGLSSVVLYFRNHMGTRTGEFMELDADHKVIRVVANYGGTAPYSAEAQVLRG